jgi:hypothetical protein
MINVKQAPRPAMIQALRERAGLRHNQAAEMVALDSFKRWSEYERSITAMDAARWELDVPRKAKPVPTVAEKVAAVTKAALREHIASTREGKTMAHVFNPYRPSVGNKFQRGRSVFVLGESYTGEWKDDSEYDDVFWQECLDGKRTDKLYVTMPQLLGMTPHQFWPLIMFTNPVPRQYRA